MKFVAGLFCWVWLVSLSGCAYLTNYTKEIDLRNGAVSIDVKQRVVFSQDRTRDRGRKDVVVCAEPSPDALTVISASGGISVPSEAGTPVNISTALSESGASIGLRTQSIQLLRDAMYRLCEGYAAGAVSETDFAAMQRRYQSTMMGLIAIEQLTGPVVAAQVLLKTSASSQAGASSGDAAVDAAKGKTDAAANQVLQARTDLEGSQVKLNDVRSEIKQVEGQRKAEAAKKDPDTTALESFADRLKSLSVDERNLRLDVADKKRRLDEAERRQQEAQADLNLAKSKVSAAALGGGSIGEVAKATLGSNQALATAVTDIVKEINRSYSKDGCLALVTELVRDPVSIEKLAKIDSGGKVSTTADSDIDARASAAARRLGAAKAQLAFVKGRLDSANSAEEKNLLNAQAVEAEQEVQVATADAARLADQARSAKEAGDKASAVAVLKTSLSVCQRILGEESRPSQ